MMRTEVVSKKLIKPYTPTPQNLNNYKLSFMDGLIPGMDVGVLLFYGESTRNQGRLEASLAKTLVQFYPLAGRYNKRYGFVDCGDQGAEFVEAKAIDAELKDVVAERNMERLSAFFPHTNHKLIDESIAPILSIQMTEFKCGGLVLGITVYHKVFDAASLETFVAAWSSTSTTGLSSINPIFDFFTLKNHINNNDVYPDGFNPPKPVVKMFSFNNKAITSLRSKLGTSRVRAVSAVIAKAMIRLDRAKHGGQSRTFVAMQAINIRERTIPPLHKHSCGNMVMSSCMEVITTSESGEIGIEELVALLGEANKKSIADCTGILSMDENGLYDIVHKPVAEAFRKLSSGEAIVVGLSDWSKFRFYEADFGWGKPVWTSIVALPNLNSIVLLGNKEGDGIEAWMHLDKNDMSLFEQYEDIRVFTT